MTVLEKYEWSDMWWDEPAKGGNRILLVGDSITRGYRQPLKELAGDNIYIDMFATSRAVDNPAYLRELKCMISHDPHYSTVHLNNGLHGFHQNIETYTKCYEEVINFFLRETGDAKIILALTTTVTKTDGPEGYDERNKTVIERNRAVMTLAEKYKLRLNDLYTEADRIKAAKANDGVHYSDEGYGLLAQQVWRVLSQ